MGGLKVSDVYCGNDLADVQIAPILNKLHRLFYIRCYMTKRAKGRDNLYITLN